jgi:hypothetical protein
MRGDPVSKVEVVQVAGVSGCCGGLVWVPRGRTTQYWLCGTCQKPCDRVSTRGKADPVGVHLDNYTGDHAGLVEHMINEHPVIHAQWDAGDTLGDLNDLHHVVHGRLADEATLVADITADNAPAYMSEIE